VAPNLRVFMSIYCGGWICGKKLSLNTDGIRQELGPCEGFPDKGTEYGEGLVNIDAHEFGTLESV
jgi:hypothetical protein